MKRPIYILLLISVSCRPTSRPGLTVAAAANMQYTVQALVAEYNKTEKTQIEVVVGASGKLTQQIIHGAPFDIFISADSDYPKKLADEHMALEPPRVYARGILVLWSARPGIRPEKDLQVLLDGDIKRIATANPKTAPYGSAAEFLLKRHGLYDKVFPKLVTGESIAQTSQFIISGSADIGFTAKAVVISGEMEGQGEWVELDTADYPPIEQSAVLLESAVQGNEAEARKFYRFLYSEKAKAIYDHFGYIVE